MEYDVRNRKIINNKNLNEIDSDKEKNFNERIWYIKYWADFIRSRPDEEWSRGHSLLIDSQFQSSKHFWEELMNSEEGRTIFERLKIERLKPKRRGLQKP